MSSKDRACNSLKRTKKVVMDENTVIIVEVFVKILADNK